MKPFFRRAALLLLALVFAASLTGVLYKLVQYRQGDQVNSEAEGLASLPDLTALPAPIPPLPQPAEEDAGASSSADSSAPPTAQPETPVYVDPYADALRSMDFTALRTVNSDVLGWILIPGTNVSYPLLQGDDNQYYLNHTWKRTKNSLGSIFMEQYNSSDLSDFHTLIYGHRAQNRAMFGSLKRYRDLSYWKKHPTVYVTDDNGSHAYQIFAAYEVSVTGDTYRLSFSGEEDRQGFLDFCLSQSVIDTGVVPTPADRILTLSTCTGNGHETRWVVQAAMTP